MSEEQAIRAAAPADPVALASEPTVAAAGPRPLVANGIGGRLELSDDTLTIVKAGAIAQLLDVLWIADGMMEKTIPLASITSVEIIRALLLPDFIRVTYASSPPQTGRYLDDALAENALIMNLVDNRNFYEIRDRIVRWQIGAQSRRTAVEYTRNLTAGIS